MRSSLVRCWTVLLVFTAFAACHDAPQAPVTPTKPGPQWIRLTMDDGVTDYPSFGGLDLMAKSDTEFDFVTVETEYGTLHYGGCVQNCQDPARWLVGTIDSGIYRGLGPNGSSVLTNTGIVVAYEDGQGPTNQIKIATCGGACYLKASWTFGDVRTGLLGASQGSHSRVLAVDPAGGVNLLYRSPSILSSLWYAHCAASCTDSASWQSVRLDSAFAVGYYDVAITVAPSGAVHALVEGDSAHALRYFLCDTGCTSGANWSSLVLATGNVGGTPTILAAPNGTLYVSYGSDHHHSMPIGFATCSSACLSLGSWSFTSLPVTSGTDVTLLLDGNEQPWLATSSGIASYYDGKTSLLHCAAGCGTAGSWTTTTVDSLGDGLDIAMAVDAKGQPHIFVSGNGVHYAQRPDTTALAH